VPVRQPYVGVDFIPKQGSMNSATGRLIWPYTVSLNKIISANKILFFEMFSHFGA
jgi:hypothetical protein